MANGDVPELGIAITGDSSSAQQATAQAKQGIVEITAATKDYGDKLAGTVETEELFNRRLDNNLASTRAEAQALRESGEAAEGMGNLHNSAFGKIITGSRAASGATRGYFETQRGGIGVIGGLARALNDLFLVVRAGAATAGPWALLALAIGVVIGVLRGISTHTGHAAKGMKDVGDESQRLKAALKEVEAESKKDLKAMEEQVQALVADYRELIGLMGEAEKRIKELDAATQKRDLAKLRLAEVQEFAGAKTDEEREAIRTKYRRLKEATQGRFESTATQNEVLQSQVRENNARRVLNALEDQRLTLVQDAAKKAQAASDAAAVGIQTARKVLGSPAIDTTTVGLPFGKSVEFGAGDPTRAAQIKILGDETIAATALRVAAENAAKALDEFDKKARAGRDEAQKEIDTARTTREKAALETETSGFQNKERAIEAKKDFASQEAGYKGGLESYRKSTEEAQMAIFHATSKEALDAAQMAYSQISDGYAAMAKESRAFTRKFGQQVQQQKNAASYAGSGN